MIKYIEISYLECRIPLNNLLQDQSEGWGTVVMLVPAPVSGAGLVPLVGLFVVVVFCRSSRMPELVFPFDRTPCIMYSKLSCTRCMWLEAAGP